MLDQGQCYFETGNERISDVRKSMIGGGGGIYSYIRVHRQSTSTEINCAEHEYLHKYSPPPPTTEFATPQSEMLQNHRISR